MPTTTNSRPRVTKRERKLHLNYDLPHRVHSACIYPVAAPNDSTLILYGYDAGLRILWRGGKRRKTATTVTQHKPNGSRHMELVMLDSVDELSTEHTDDGDAFEAEDEELDPDCPYPGIIQDLDLPTGSAVLHLAVPAIPTIAAMPRLLRLVAVVVISSADGALRMLQIPLAPPADESKEEVVQSIVRSQGELLANGSLPADLSIKFSPADSQILTAQKKQKENVLGQLLVASAGRSLLVWSVSVTADAIIFDDKLLVQNVPLRSAATHVAFHPSSRSTQLLLSEHDGVARIYDPFALRTPLRRPGSSDSSVEVSSGPAEPGKWIMAFRTPYQHQAAGDASISPMLERRKKILDAKWIMSGKGIFALLADGQWGMWDLFGSAQPGKQIEHFAINGFLASASSNEPVEPTMSKKSSSKLAPMTPNTRKSRAEQLFTGTSKPPGAVCQGGISVASNTQNTGYTDESVALWYDSEVYVITSVQNFWQRSTTGSGQIGSLHAPGLSHITEVNLNNECITSISQFNTKSSIAAIGRLNTPRDIFISAEHRVIVLQNIRPPIPARSLFQVAERPASQHPLMADGGNAGLSDIDLALEGMAADNAGSLRIGFAH